MKKVVLFLAAVLCCNPAAFPSPEIFQSGYDGVVQEMAFLNNGTVYKPLSEYDEMLDGTAFDTPIIIIGAENAGKSCFIGAGVHGNEIAGILAAYWIGEKCSVSQGKLVVMPRINASGMVRADDAEIAQRVMKVAGRVFHYGSRLTDWRVETIPDPAAFVPPEAPAHFTPLAGKEARNINRNYPGSESGSMTSRVAGAITRLLLELQPCLAIDLHEASPTSKLAWSMITRKAYLDEAALAVLDVEEQTGVSFHLEDSRDEFSGYSHWEWGKLGIHAFLVETLNPAQPDDNPEVDQLNNSTAPLALRVFVHLKAVENLILSMNLTLSDTESILVSGFPAAISEVSDWLQGNSQ